MLSTVLVLGMQKWTGQTPALEETQREQLMEESLTQWDGVGSGEGTPHRAPLLSVESAPWSRGPAADPLLVPRVPGRREPDRSGAPGQRQRQETGKGS